MKIILTSNLFGKVIWEVPQELASILDAPEKTVTDLLQEISSDRGWAADIAGKAKGEVLAVIQAQVRAFFELLTIAHRNAQIANPPSKYSRIIQEGLAWTATKIKAASRSL
ncbi:MAG TPA: hypothetical protein DEF00_00915 [Candidatus Taylorbacteria bacterium]|nr:MAG: hypothetical protein UY03_C0020G0004 [Parcubacteria group bacterium GW2011_GWA2_47_64]KKU95794.1 MAG: hypothetical protein UY29_C0019G0014 [Parcubacteria group bacterium GW2011_GWC2_48_17]HBV00940.1 hypothetical protein [Candidatus Taylorbacteria bacterium]